MRLFLVFLLILSCTLFGQDSGLFQSRELRAAYAKKTRSLDGKPGSAYWQNSSSYKLDMEFFPETRTLEGSAEIQYTNNSPDSLDRLVVRLYQDIFKKGTMRDFQLDSRDVNDGVVIKKFQINGISYSDTSASAKLERYGTNATARLDEKLAPGETTTLLIDWSTVIPQYSRVRMGAYSATDFFIAYFYPQMAVYDDIDGWDTYSYTGRTEMYNDFSDFHYSVTLPEGFLCWGTGELQNASTVLAPEVYNRFHLSRTSDTLVRIVTADHLALGGITAKGKQTWEFKATSVPDIAFAVSSTYLWDAISFVVDKKSGRRAVAEAVYNRESKDFYQVAEISKKSIEYFSFEMPGIPYPYPKMTVFNGQGGMEFPMMVNNGSASNLAGTVHLTSHEICHTYFPFYMGTNERKYAFMDEGWATMLPFEFQSREGDGYDPIARNATSYAQFAGKESEVPPMIPSVQMSGYAYRSAAYVRPGLAYEYLMRMLGKELFLKALQEYMTLWAGKHPLPFDFFNTFNRVTGRNLDWYWSKWFFEQCAPDLGIEEVSGSDGQTTVYIVNKGGLPLPVIVTAYFEDNSSETIILSPDEWETKDQAIMIFMGGKVISVHLGDAQIPDIDPSDNVVNLLK